MEGKVERSGVETDALVRSAAMGRALAQHDASACACEPRSAAALYTLRLLAHLYTSAVCPRW